MEQDKLLMESDADLNSLREEIDKLKEDEDRLRDLRQDLEHRYRLLIMKKTIEN
ncbi:MAG: hypothetical protein PVJ38_05740 [Candidatus Bathyarchaeota archaeon]|jgi:hypothetical protein